MFFNWLKSQWVKQRKHRGFYKRLIQTTTWTFVMTYTTWGLKMTICEFCCSQSRFPINVNQKTLGLFQLNVNLHKDDTVETTNLTLPPFLSKTGNMCLIRCPRTNLCIYLGFMDHALLFMAWMNAWISHGMGQQSIFSPSLPFVWFVDSFEEGLVRPHLHPNYGLTAAEYMFVVYNAHDLQPSLT